MSSNFTGFSILLTLYQTKQNLVKDKFLKAELTGYFLILQHKLNGELLKRRKLFLKMKEKRQILGFRSKEKLIRSISVF